MQAYFLANYAESCRENQRFSKRFMSKRDQ